jgi:uncharacterized cysteine cluster protein YcgN (CxxCxxCC family)
MDKVPAFWEHKELAEMSLSEWESLCDGCGKCCLHKLQDEDTDELLFTSISCEYLNLETCRCKVYSERKSYVPGCLTLSPKHLDELNWLPSSCAYRLLHEGKPLPSWHYLVCGDTQALHVQHISVRGKVISEADLADDQEWDDYVVESL